MLPNEPWRRFSAGSGNRDTIGKTDSSSEASLILGVGVGGVK